MFCESVMHAGPTHIHRDAHLHEAVDLMAERHMQVLMVVGQDDRFVGELSVNQFAKALLPRSVFLEYEGHEDEAQRETLADVVSRLTPYLERPIADFIDHDVPVVRPKTPLIDALMLLRGGALRIPVVDGPNDRLVGAISMLTVMRIVHSHR